MFGHLGFSYVGLIFMLMLLIPNLLWMKKQPQGYSAEKENRFLALLERVGEALTTCCALIFSDFNLRQWSNWSWWFVAASALMVMYEIWWIRYFKTDRLLQQFLRDSRGRRHPAGTCVFSAWRLRKSGVDADGKYYFGDRAYRYSSAASQGEFCLNVIGQ